MCLAHHDLPSRTGYRDSSDYLKVAALWQGIYPDLPIGINNWQGIGQDLPIGITSWQGIGPDLPIGITNWHTK